MKKDYDGQVEQLDYIPTVDAIYAELSKQAGTYIPRPSMARCSQEQLQLPLTDAEQEEEYEAGLYIIMFAPPDTAPPPAKYVPAAPAPNPPVEEDSESTESDDVIQDEEPDFEEPALKQRLEQVIQLLQQHQ